MNTADKTKAPRIYVHAIAAWRIGITEYRRCGTLSTRAATKITRRDTGGGGRWEGSVCRSPNSPHHDEQAGLLTISLVSPHCSPHTPDMPPPLLQPASPARPTPSSHNPHRWHSAVAATRECPAAWPFCLLAGPGFPSHLSTYIHSRQQISHLLSRRLRAALITHLTSHTRRSQAHCSSRPADRGDEGRRRRRRRERDRDCRAPRTVILFLCTALHCTLHLRTRAA